MSGNHKKARKEGSHGTSTRKAMCEEAITQHNAQNIPMPQGQEPARAYTPCFVPNKRVTRVHPYAQSCRDLRKNSHIYMTQCVAKAMPHTSDGAAYLQNGKREADAARLPNQRLYLRPQVVIASCTAWRLRRRGRSPIRVPDMAVHGAVGAGVHARLSIGVECVSATVESHLQVEQ